MDAIVITLGINKFKHDLMRENGLSNICDEEKRATSFQNEAYTLPTKSRDHKRPTVLYSTWQRGFSRGLDIAKSKVDQARKTANGRAEIKDQKFESEMR